MRAAAVAAVLLAAAAAAPGAEARKLTFKVTSVTLSLSRADRAPKGTSKGDTIEYRDRLVNAASQFGRAKGAVVGSDHGTMTFTSAHTARFSGAAALPGGTIRLQGAVTALSGGQLAIPVAGGTGRYAGATGYVLVGPGDKRVLNTYALTVPGAPVA